MSKYRILSPIYFDGVCFPAGTIVDTTTIPISGEALVERSWGEVYEGDEPAVESVDVLRDAMPKPVVEPVVEPNVEPIAEPIAEPTDSTDSSDSSDPTDPPDQSDPSEHPEPKPRKRKS